MQPADSDRSPLTPAAPHRDRLLAGRRARGRFIVPALGTVAVLALLVLGVRFAENHLAPASYLSDVRAENLELRRGLAKARFDLEVEMATRTELERQVSALNEQLKQAQEELAFLKSAGAGAPGK